MMELSQLPIPCAVCGDSLDDCVEPVGDCCTTCAHHRLPPSEGALTYDLITFPRPNRAITREVQYAKAA